MSLLTSAGSMILTGNALCVATGRSDRHDPDVLGSERWA
jgi:hypothetical protein